MKSNHEQIPAQEELVAAYEHLLGMGNPFFLEEEHFAVVIDFYDQEELLEKALEAAQHAIETHPFATDFYARKAQLLIRNGEEIEAMELLEEALSISPAELGLLLIKAEALAAMDQIEDALALLSACKEDADAKDMSYIYVVESIIHEQEEEYEAMYDTLSQALKAYPRNDDAIERFWLAVELTNKHEECIAALEAVIDNHPYSWLGWYYLGHASAYVGNYPEAIDAYEFAFTINENMEAAYRDCAELCMEIKDYERALKWYLDIMAQFDADSEVLQHIGQCYHYLGDYRTARSFYSRAMRIDPHNDEIYYNNAQCLAAEGKWKEAVRYYRKALSIEDHQEDYHAALGQAYLALGNYRQAEPAFRRATELAPEDPLYWLVYSVFLSSTNRSEEAVELLAVAEQIAPHPRIMYGRVACLFKIGRRQEASYWLGEALAEDFEAHGTLFDVNPDLAQDSLVQSLIANYQNWPE